MKKIASSALVGICACWSPVAYSQSEPQVTLDVSVGAGVSTNPFLYSDGKTAASATINIAPSIFVEDELGQSRIDGNLRFSQYSKRYGNDVSARIQTSSERKLDERTSARIDAAFQTLRSAVQEGFIFDGSIPPEAGVVIPPTLPIIDTTIAGTRARVTNLSMGASVSHVLDELSSVNGGVALSATYIGDRVGFDYRNASAELGYNRKISERTTLTLGTQVGVVDYLDRQPGDSFIISPRAGIRQQLNSRLSLVADAGISYVRTDIGMGSRRSTVSFAGSLGLCDRSPNRSLCISGGRSAQPTALGGVSTVTTASLSYDHRLSDVDHFTLAARYGRTNQNGIGLPFTRATDFAGASATYSRDLNDRIAFTVTPSFSKIYEDGRRRDANFALMIGLTVKLGRQR